MIWDAHMHTSFSGDCESAPEEMIQSAINKGLPGICFTDHLDYDYLQEPGLFDLDIPSYKEKIQQLQQEYENQFSINFGIELGLQPHLAEKNNKVIETFDFDFVIGSSHVCDTLDPYYPDFYEGRTEAEAYRRYFESILENIQTEVDFDVYGHLDYVVRYGPNKNLYYSYSKYADIIDEILKALLKRNKGIELNTGALSKGLKDTNPCFDIVKRYRELGGEIITIGADAHLPENVGGGFDKIPDLLKRAGFDYYTVFSARVPCFVKIP